MYHMQKQNIVTKKLNSLCVIQVQTRGIICMQVWLQLSTIRPNNKSILMVILGFVYYFLWLFETDLDTYYDS